MYVELGSRLLPEIGRKHETIVRLYHRARRLMSTEAAADLEHCAVAVRPAESCCAKQIAVGISDQATVRRGRN